MTAERSIDASRLFQGFTAETLQFFRDLSENNNKAWFEDHRSSYEEHVLEPLAALSADLSAWMLSVDPGFEVRPVVGRTISRIFRDTRFSRDKAPLRPFMWVVFKRPSRERASSPGFFFEIHSAWYRYGMGMYAASKPTMDRFRERIDGEPERFVRAIGFHVAGGPFQLVADRYVRALPSRHPDFIDEWYQAKSFFLSTSRRASPDLYAPTLVDQLLQDYQPLVPLYRFLVEV